MKLNLPYLFFCNLVKIAKRVPVDQIKSLDQCKLTKITTALMHNVHFERYAFTEDFMSWNVLFFLFCPG